jgi:hypothetical protein
MELFDERANAIREENRAVRRNKAKETEWNEWQNKWMVDRECGDLK